MHRLSGFMRTYWTRVFMQWMWLAALVCKLLGSSWDVSWHFTWLRDDLALRSSIAEMRTAFADGKEPHLPPVSWTSIRVGAIGLVVTWSIVTALVARSIGPDTARPPMPTPEHGPEPRRDARRALDGWAAAPAPDQVEIPR